MKGIAQNMTSDLHACVTNLDGHDWFGQIDMFHKGHYGKWLNLQLS